MLFDKLNCFPKISNKKPQKLRELADLLKEVELARLGGYLPGLSFLDTAWGVAPIVKLIPSNLQEKWMTKGPNTSFSSRYHFLYSHFSQTLYAGKPTCAMTQVSHSNYLHPCKA